MPGDNNSVSKVERYKERAPEIRFLTLAQMDEQLDVLASNVQLQTMAATLNAAPNSTGSRYQRRSCSVDPTRFFQAALL